VLQELPEGTEKVVCCRNCQKELKNSMLQELPEGTEKVVCCRNCQKELKKWCAAGTARRN